MNKVYKTVWNEALQVWVAASELSGVGRNRTKREGRQGEGCESRPRSQAKSLLAAMSVMFGSGLLLSGNAHARGEVDACWNGGGSGFQGQQVFIQNGATGCNGTADPNSGVVIRQYTAGTGSEQAYVTVGQVDPVTTSWNVGPNGTPVSGGGMVRLGALNGIYLDSTTSLAGHKITNLAAGTAQTDAVNVSQLTSLSTSTADAIASLQQDVESVPAHYVSVNDVGSLGGKGGNYTNDGARGANAMAVGVNAVANGDHSVALGDGAMAGEQRDGESLDTVAIGHGATANLVNSVALGAGSQTGVAPLTPMEVKSATVGNTVLDGFAGSNAVGVVSVGSVGAERRIINVAAGQVTQTSTDAVNGSQLYAATQRLDQIQTQVTTNTTNITNIENQINGGGGGGGGGTNPNNPGGGGGGGTNPNNPGGGGGGGGGGTNPNNPGGGGGGGNPLAPWQPGPNNGPWFSNDGPGGSGGGGNLTGGDGGTNTNGKDNTNFGKDGRINTPEVPGDGNTNFGNKTSIDGNRNTNNGQDAHINGDDNVNNGQGAKTDGNGNTNTGQGAGINGNNNSNYGHNAQTTGDDNVNIGKDAKTNGNGNTTTGAGATSTGDSNLTQGRNAMTDGTYNSALGANATATGDHATALGAGSTATAPNATAIGANSVADQANTVSVGSVGNERRIVNVADGVAPTDAVNKRQLDAVQGQVSGVARNAYSGIAAATALTMIPDVDQGKTIAVGIGGGTFQGYAATAIGISARVTENIKVKAGAGMSAAGKTFGVGASYQW
ncbi:hypothetical protein C5615_32210 [Burkholderia cepacia]|uniref:Uncharacterized protein n=1 Tax=Burkholderia cepacia TaxID=292 RepID=A0A2S8I9R4_BURCE|nr:hypothetical protein C5615_32210 [Burkholderia cepacia]HDR9511021.1 YadA-like family protein [Burkholderia cepacia]